MGHWQKRLQSSLRPALVPRWGLLVIVLTKSGYMKLMTDVHVRVFGVRKSYILVYINSIFKPVSILSATHQFVAVLIRIVLILTYTSVYCRSGSNVDLNVTYMYVIWAFDKFLLPCYYTS